MLWEKKTSLSQKRGYLYIRETKYIRDGRTKKRKPPCYGDGSAYKERGKYSVKKDIYCGKITEPPQIKYVISFQEYIEKIKQKEFLIYKIETEFEDIIDDYYEYLLYIYDIDKDDFYSGKKKAYDLDSGFVSREGISFLKRFKPRKTLLDSKELERFANRSIDCGIFDEDIIALLYVKCLSKEVQTQFKEEEVEEFFKQEETKISSLKDFISSNH
jgi:hypothetical protein